MPNDYQDWGVPSAIAAQINALGLATSSLQATASQISAAIAGEGVPLLNKAGVMITESSITIPASGSVTYTASPVQPGYDMYLDLQAAAGATSPVNISLVWQESTSGVNVDIQSWWAFAGGPTYSHELFGSGPTRGDSLTVTVTNGDSVNAVVIGTLVVMQNSRVYPRHALVTNDVGGADFQVPGYTTPYTDAQAGILARSSISIAAGASQTRLLPLYSGMVAFKAGTDAGDTTGYFYLHAVADTGNAGGDVPFSGYTNSHGALFARFPLPRAQCVVNMVNKGTATQTLNVNMVPEQ